MLVSVWYVWATALFGCIGIVAALWRGGSLFATALANRPIWIVTYYDTDSPLVDPTSFPVFSRKCPTVEWLRENEPCFNPDWYDGNVVVDGPWYCGMYPYK